METLKAQVSWSWTMVCVLDAISSCPDNHEPCLIPHTEEDVAMPPESSGPGLALDSSAQAAIQHEHHSDGPMEMSDGEVVAFGPRQASPSHEPLQLHAARQDAADNNEQHEARSGEMGEASPLSATNEDYEMRDHGIDMEAPAPQRPQSEFHPTELKTEPHVALTTHMQLPKLQLRLTQPAVMIPTWIAVCLGLLMVTAVREQLVA
jgi:hypothetical protein